MEKLQKGVKLTDLDKESLMRLRKEVEEDFKKEVEDCLQTRKENEELKEKLRMSREELNKLKPLQRGKTKDNKK